MNLTPSQFKEETWILFARFQPRQVTARQTAWEQSTSSEGESTSFDQSASLVNAHVAIVEIDSRTTQVQNVMLRMGDDQVVVIRSVVYRLVVRVSREDRKWCVYKSARVPSDVIPAGLAVLVYWYYSAYLHVTSAFHALQLSTFSILIPRD